MTTTVAGHACTVVGDESQTQKEVTRNSAEVIKKKYNNEDAEGKRRTFVPADEAYIILAATINEMEAFTQKKSEIYLGNAFEIKQERKLLTTKG